MYSLKQKSYKNCFLFLFLFVSELTFRIVILMVTHDQPIKLMATSTNHPPIQSPLVEHTKTVSKQKTVEFQFNGFACTVMQRESNNNNQWWYLAPFLRFELSSQNGDLTVAMVALLRATFSCGHAHIHPSIHTYTHIQRTHAHHTRGGHVCSCVRFYLRAGATNMYNLVCGESRTCA